MKKWIYSDSSEQLLSPFGLELELGFLSCPIHHDASKLHVNELFRDTTLECKVASTIDENSGSISDAYRTLPLV